jgi:nicotinate-nucleotide pyrophosphorylase (carboxylating)
MSLSDAILIKENHLKLCRMSKADWRRSVATLRRQEPGVPVQIEVQTTRDLKQAIPLNPQRILLDNLSIAELRKMIRTVRRELPHAEIEVSGGVRPEELPALSRLGVERISMGRITHSAPAFDCSLDFLHVDTH